MLFGITLSLIAVSGIIDSQEERVKDALIKGGLTYIKTVEENDWNAMMFVKDGKN